MELIIDRKIWLRGEGSDDSYLLRNSDNKQCCVGFLCEALGIDRETLKGKKVADRFEVPKWMTERWGPEKMIGECPLDIQVAYETNDSTKLTEAEREARIAEIFARHDIQVKFID
jgi:hypothetical protein